MKPILLAVLIIIFFALIAAMIFPMLPVIYGIVISSSIFCIVIIVDIYNLTRKKKR